MKSFFVPPPLDPDSAEFRRLSLRSAVQCIAYCEIVSAICVLPLYFLVVIYNIGHEGYAIQIMTLVAAGLLLSAGFLILFAAIYENSFYMDAAIWLVAIGALYRTILALMGGIHYARYGTVTVHYLLSFIYFSQLLIVLGILCQDLKLMIIYKHILENDL